MLTSPIRLIACTNERLSSDQRSCAASGSYALIDKIKHLITVAGLDVAVIERKCLGRCLKGPVMRIAPGGPFFEEVSEADLSAIVGEIRSMLDQHRQVDD